MAAACRSSWKRLIQSKTLTPSIPKSIPHASAPPRFAPLRFASALASVDSMMPLHSAIASARLTSKIAFDSTCWSCLSQDEIVNELTSLSLTKSNILVELLKEPFGYMNTSL